MLKVVCCLITLFVSGVVSFSDSGQIFIAAFPAIAIVIALQSLCHHHRIIAVDVVQLVFGCLAFEHCTFEFYFNFEVRRN